RPLPQRDYEMLDDWHRKRYLVLPGVTGLWQGSGRAELAFAALVHLDFLYLEHWSLALDLTILLKTIPAVVSRRGAYSRGACSGRAPAGPREGGSRRRHGGAAQPPEEGTRSFEL